MLDTQAFNKSKQIYPMKLITTKCKMIWAKMKSAKPLSGLIPSKCVLFCGFTCKK